MARALETQAGDKIDKQAALLAHHCEEAGETLNAARWHCRAARWAGLNDINAAIHHWLRVRDLVRQDDGSEASALVALACSQALPFAWRTGAYTTAWSDVFEDGCTAATRTNNLAALAMLNSVYGAVRGNNHAAAIDFVRYSSAGVRIADQTGDLALRVGARAPLLFGHLYAGQLQALEQVADEIVSLAADDPHLGAEFAGFSPLLAALGARPFAVGSLRDPVTALCRFASAQQLALDSGYPEQALWAMVWEMALRYALQIPDKVRTLSRTSLRLAENLGTVNEIIAAIGHCDALAWDGDWSALATSTTSLLALIQHAGSGSNFEARLLAHQGRAHLELGDLPAARTAAQAGVAFIQRSQALHSVHCYAVLARVQLALAEPAADIAHTLDEYDALLIRTGARVYEGELHELRARLAEREGRRAERAAALHRAYECYTRFGMTAQAARVVDALGSAA